MAENKTTMELEHSTSDKSGFFSVRGQSHSGSVSQESEDDYQSVSSSKEKSGFISVRGQSHFGSVSQEPEDYQSVFSRDVSSVMRRWDIETPIDDPLCESQCVSASITDMCSLCASKGIGIIATHICRGCSQYGRYFCQRCWDYHNRFLPTHDTLSLSVSSERLSRMMGNKLGDNNPDLADLSDKNRPTKIAEKYTELFDNEWTDAFEVCLTESATEKQAIATLLQLLQDAKEACDTFAKEQAQKLKETVKMNQATEHLPDLTIKHMKDFRRFTAYESLPGVLEKCLSAARNKSYVRLLRHKDVLPFFKGCVELCWFMNVQDPPLAFGDTPTRNKPFDTNIFKFYTATGSYFDFMVWPVLHLTKDGALLTKGVAQACSGHQPEWQSHENRQAKSSRNKEISYPFVYSRQVVSPVQNVDPHRIQSNHDNKKSSSNQLMQNVQNKNYEQIVEDKSDHTSDKTKLFSQTVKQHVSASVADRMTRNFGSSHRHFTSDTYIKQDLKPSRPELNVWSKFKRLIKVYGINSPIVREGMGKDYESCIAYYNYLYGNRSTESDV